MTSLETGSISEETTKNETTMMSDNTEDSKTMSNNVSSILNNRTSNNEIMSTIGLPQYSVDLSHASKDPMFAGPKELFQKNVTTNNIKLLNFNYVSFFLIGR